MIEIKAKPQRIKQASPMQWAAMSINNHDILVSAAAGSGKTKVLAERIASRIFDSYIDVNTENLSISQFVVVTFTEASAKEMKLRIEQQLRHHFSVEHFTDETSKMASQLYLKQQLIELAQAPISTLHAFCLSIIKEHYYQIEEYYQQQLHSLNPDYQVANQQQLEEVKLLAITKVHQVLENNRHFYHLYRLLSGDRNDSKFNATIFKSYNHMMSTAHPLKWLENTLDYYYLPEHQSQYYQDIILNLMLPQIEQYLNYINQQLRVHLSLAKNSTYLDVINNKEEHLQSKIIQAIEANLATIEQCLFHLHQCQQQSTLESCSQSFELVQDSLLNFKQWTIAKDRSRKEELLEVAQNYNAAIDDFMQQIDNIGKLPKDIEWYCQSDILQSWQKQQDLLPLMNALKQSLTLFHDYFITAKRQMNLIDFQDFEQLALNLLAQHDDKGQFLYDDVGQIIPSDLAKQYQNKIIEIYVDEYQDTNEVQESILNLVRHQTAATFFRVGDLKQSIYKFRQANPKLFIDKADNYYPLELPQGYIYDKDVELIKSVNNKQHNGLLIHLSENYRSHYTVLESINYLFNHLMDKTIGELDYDEHAALYYPQVKSDNVPFADTTVIDQAELVLLQNHLTDDEEEESLSSVEQQAEYVAQQIHHLVKENDGIQYGDFTILQRSIQSAPVYQRIFAKYDIPFYSQMEDGFMVTDEVQTMMSCLRVIDNQNQDIPLVALLRSPLFAFTDEQLAYIRILSPKGEFAVQARKVAYRLSEIEVPEELDTTTIQYLSQQLRQVFDSIALWREYVKNHALTDLIQYIYQYFYYPERVLGLTDGKIRRLNLMQFKEFVQEYEANYVGSDLINFINYVDNLLSQQQDMQPPNIAKNNVVTMMTIHGSKGLEFKYVYLVGAEKKFNEQNYREDYLVNKQDGVALKYYDSVNNTKMKTIFLQSLIYRERQEMLSEELRLLYVALTRAEYKFTIIASVNNVTEDDTVIVPPTLSQHNKVHSYQRYQAKSYLDFILAVIRMHPTAWQNLNLTQTQQWQLNNVTEQRANWRVIIAKPQQDDLPQWVENETVPQITFVQQVQHTVAQLDIPAIKEKVINSSTIDLPSKFGVSRLKKLHQQFNEVQPMYLQYKQLDLTSDDISQEMILSATDTGTLIHRIIELLINAKQVITSQAQLVDVMDDYIKQGQVEQLLGEQFMMQTASLEMIYHFTQSTTYQQILTSQIAKTEYPFISRVPLVNIDDSINHEEILQVSEMQGVYTGLDNLQLNDSLLVQGIIDCLIQVNPQHYIIIDFKSDKIRDRSEKELVEVYRPQLSLYKQAIYQMLVEHQPEVKVEAILYYLQANQAFEV